MYCSLMKLLPEQNKNPKKIKSLPPSVIFIKELETARNPSSYIDAGTSWSNTYCNSMSISRVHVLFACLREYPSSTRPDAYMQRCTLVFTVRKHTQTALCSSSTSISDVQKEAKSLSSSYCIGSEVPKYSSFIF